MVHHVQTDSSRLVLYFQYWKAGEEQLDRRSIKNTRSIVLFLPKVQREGTGIFAFLCRNIRSFVPSLKFPNLLFRNFKESPAELQFLGWSPVGTKKRHASFRALEHKGLLVFSLHSCLRQRPVHLEWNRHLRRPGQVLGMRSEAAHCQPPVHPWVPIPVQRVQSWSTAQTAIPRT